MNSLDAHGMAEEVVRLSGEYSTMSEELAAILTMKAIRWSTYRTQEGVKSDKQADKIWDATNEGLREMQLKLILKANEKRQSALKSMLRILEGEARNSY
jgi:hypothetical protein